jgi:hypothetical protein
VVLAAGDHWTELGEALRVALPMLLGALVISGLIFGAIVRPPERMRVGVTESRRQLVLVGAAIPLGTLAGFFVLYWAL